MKRINIMLILVVFILFQRTVNLRLSHQQVQQNKTQINQTNGNVTSPGSHNFTNISNSSNLTANSSKVKFQLERQSTDDEDDLWDQSWQSQSWQSQSSQDNYDSDSQDSENIDDQDDYDSDSDQDSDQDSEKDHHLYSLTTQNLGVKPRPAPPTKQLKFSVEPIKASQSQSLNCLRQCKKAGGVNCKTYNDNSAIQCCKASGCQFPFSCKKNSQINIQGCVKKV